MRSPKSPRKRLLDQFPHKPKWNPRGKHGFLLFCFSLLHCYVHFLIQLTFISIQTVNLYFDSYGGIYSVNGSLVFSYTPVCSLSVSAVPLFYL